MKGNLRLMRDGEVKLTIHSPEVVIKSDGTIWHKQGFPILGISDPVEKERINKIVKAEQWAKIPAEYFVRLGANDNGVTALDEEAWNSHPAKIESDRMAEEKAREQAKIVTIYLSSRGWGDYSPVEWVGDITRDDADILAECHELLKNGHDVDEQDQSDDALKAKISAARKNWAGKEERERKNAEDGKQHIKHLIATGYCFSCESYCHGDCGHYSSDPSIRYNRQLRGAIAEQNYGIND